VAETEVRAVIEAWAKATRQNRKDDVLKNHVSDLVVFDVLPPMKYESAESYRRSWDGWQPETQGEMTHAQSPDQSRVREFPRQLHRSLSVLREISRSN
jgi:ketosteroid isomerase-like protein